MMASKKRWYVIRPFKLNSGDVQAGRYLTAAEMKEIPEHSYRVLVRGVRLYDMDGQMDNSWGERNKHKLRIRCLNEIGTKEAAQIADLCMERLAENRMTKFGGKREKAIAKEIRDSAKATPPSKPKPPAKEKVKEDAPTPEPEPEKSNAVDDLLGEAPETAAPETEAPKVKTRRRHKSK